jgi:hypothetical protein
MCTKQWTGAPSNGNVYQPEWTYLPISGQDFQVVEVYKAVGRFSISGKVYQTVNRCTRQRTGVRSNGKVYLAVDNVRKAMKMCASQ